MHSLALLVAAASLGVDYGWQPTDDGQLEYIIQMEPSLLPLLKQGKEIVTEVHPESWAIALRQLEATRGHLLQGRCPSGHEAVVSPADEVHGRTQAGDADCGRQAQSPARPGDEDVLAGQSTRQDVWRPPVPSHDGPDLGVTEQH